MIIKFWDNEKWEYPLLNIEDEDYGKFKELLEKYQKEDEYNFDDFIQLLQDNNIYANVIKYDVEVFF